MRSKVMFLIILWIFIFPVLVFAEEADVVYDTGIVVLEIKNRPPHIKDLYFVPEVVYPDTILECMVDINDEKPDLVELQFNWYVNGNLQKDKNYFFTGFEEEDEVICEIIPTDEENVVGETKSISIVISKKPLLTTITGFVVGTYGKNPTITLMIPLLMLLFISISFLFIAKYRFPLGRIKGATKIR